MQLGLNHLADLTHAEYKAHHLGYRADLREARNASTGLGAAPFRYADASPPEHVDWVKAGAVTKVKNQQQVRLCICFGLELRSLCLCCFAVMLMPTCTPSVHLLPGAALALEAWRLHVEAGCFLSCSAVPAGRSPPLAASKVTCCSAHFHEAS